MSDSDETLIQVKVTDPVATIILNRPHKRNSLTRDMIAQVRGALEDLYREKRVRAIVLTGVGSSFCGGRDVQEQHETSSDPQADHQRWGEEANEYRELLVEMLRMPKPMIASVNGPAVAGGAGLVLACDLVVACEGASFGVPDPRLGVVAGMVGPLMAFRLGAGQAARLLVSSEMISGEEAHRLGIYHEIVRENFLWARAVELGTQCAAGAPEAVGLTKRLLHETIGENLLAQLSNGAITTAMARTTEAAQEGLAAYLEKRTPDWK